jgi:uncharacterized protein
VHSRYDLEAGGVTTVRSESRPDAEPPDGIKGTLSLQRCQSCGRYPSYPRIRCPVCLGELQWISADGIGSIVDVAVVHRPQDARYEPYLPIVMAHIALREGVEVIATILGENRLKARIGSRVVVSAQQGWSTLPQFELSSLSLAGHELTAVAEVAAFEEG